MSCIVAGRYKHRAKWVRALALNSSLSRLDLTLEGLSGVGAKISEHERLNVSSAATYPPCPPPPFTVHIVSTYITSVQAQLVGTVRQREGRPHMRGGTWIPGPLRPLSSLQSADPISTFPACVNTIKAKVNARSR